jgi:autotransporter-associated beta strand protein
MNRVHYNNRLCGRGERHWLTAGFIGQSGKHVCIIRSALLGGVALLALQGAGAAGLHWGNAYTWNVDIANDTHLSSLVAPPSGYYDVTYKIANGSTLTLDAGGNNQSPVYLAGSGNFINNGVISTTGQAITTDMAYFGSSYVSVTNNGTISAAIGSGDYALYNYDGITAITNNGTITATGGGGIYDLTDYWDFTNTGTINADRTAVYFMPATNTKFTNSGTIHSNYGIGVYDMGSGPGSTNSGTIYGQAIGVQLLAATLTNSGTISSPGLAVSMDAHSKLVNTASGIIDGSIGVPSLTFNRTIDNAGIISGNVDLGATSSIDSGNTFIARAGSLLKGNLVLGSGGDTFVTTIVNTGPGQFAGVLGSVSGTGKDTIRFLASEGAATRPLDLPTLFNRVELDVSNNATVTFTKGSAELASMGLSGTGSADVTVDISATNGPVLLDLTQPSMQTEGISGTPVPTAINVTSRGTLSSTRTDALLAASPVVVLSTASTFTNEGTVTLIDSTPQDQWSLHLAAVTGPGTVVNKGTINFSVADGISGNSGMLTVVNSGIISELPGSTGKRGIVFASSVTNSGTISVSGNAVVFGSYVDVPTLTNSGQIISSNDTAITDPYYSQPFAGWGCSSAPNLYWCGRPNIVNQAGGTISGHIYGIYIPGSGSVTNAGLISGDTAAIVFANGGGTLTLQTGSKIVGDVIGGGSDKLVLQGSGSEDSVFLNFATLDMQGPGTWTLSGANAINATTVSGGTLVITGTLAGTYTIDSGATLQGSTATLLTTAPVANNGTLVFDQSSDGTFGQAITGTGALVKTGTGALTLTAANTYSDGTTVSAGALIASSDSVLGATTGGLTLAGGTLRFASQFNLAATRGVVLGAGGGVIDTNGFDTALSQTVSGTGGLTKSGPGTLTLSAANSYSGATTIQSGTLALDGNGSIAASSGVVDNATFDISTTNTGTTIQSLSGNGAVVLGDKTLTISNASGEFSGTIAGSGALVLTGGSEILSGDSSYTGGTTIATGATLQIGNGGTTGWITGNVVDNGVLVFDRSDDINFAGDISGTGGVSFTGTGRVTLAGHNTYTGKLGIGSGAIVHMSDIGSVTGDIANNGTLDFDNSGDQSFASNISGSGNLTFTGGGTLTLTGNNTYTGNTVITAGMLNISSDANLGNGGTLVLANGTGVILTGGGTFNHPATVAGDPVFNVASGTTVTWAGQISDGTTPGDVEVTGGGTLILTAANTYTGGTTIRTGNTLQLGNGGATGSVVGTIANNGTLAINRSDNLASSNTITGTGGMVKNGTNTLTLNAVSTYTGATTVAAGRLVVGDAAHATAAIDSRTGGVTVANGASLSGFGTVAGAVANNGTIVTGQSSGSLTVGGLTQGSSGTLAVELSPSASSQLTVTGAANLGGTLSANFTAGSSTPHLYSVLTAGSINGTFANVTTSGAVTDMVYTVNYAPREVDIVTAPKTIGQIYGDLRTATFDTAFALNGMVMDRLGDCPSCSSWSFWARGVLSTAHTEGNSSIASFDNDLTGAMGGVDYRFENGISAHAVVGYATSDLTLKGLAEKASTSSVFFSLAGHAPVAGFEIDGSFFYMQNSTDLTRDTQLSGIASSTPDSSTYGFGVKAGYPLFGGDLVPEVRLSYATVNQSTTEETGGGMMDLALAGNDVSELRGDIGAILRHRFTTGDIVLVPAFKLFLDETLSAAPDYAAARFAVAASGFDSPAAKADRTAALIGAGLTGEFGNGLAIDVGFNSRIGSKQTEMIGSFGLNWHF